MSLQVCTQYLVDEIFECPARVERCDGKRVSAGEAHVQGWQHVGVVQRTEQLISKSSATLTAFQRALTAQWDLKRIYAL